LRSRGGQIRGFHSKNHKEGYVPGRPRKKRGGKLWVEVCSSPRRKKKRRVKARGVLWGKGHIQQEEKVAGKRWVHKSLVHSHSSDNHRYRRNSKKSSQTGGEGKGVSRDEAGHRRTDVTYRQRVLGGGYRERNHLKNRKPAPERRESEHLQKTGTVGVLLRGARSRVGVSWQWEKGQFLMGGSWKKRIPDD